MVSCLIDLYHARVKKTTAAIIQPIPSPRTKSLQNSDVKTGEGWWFDSGEGELSSSIHTTTNPLSPSFCLSKMAALALVNDLIAKLEGELGLKPDEEYVAPGTAPPASSVASSAAKDGKKAEKKDGVKKEKKEKAPKPAKVVAKKDAAPPADHPIICQIEFKVGVITKVWTHPDADKLWCEEIDCGEAEPRQICSGLRDYYTEEQMLGMRLLVVANLKAKNLKGFKSHGMVLCAKSNDGKVQFINPPADAPLGEIVQYEGMPEVIPASPAQVEKKKMFLAIIEKLVTNDKFEGTWDGHVFTTSAGPCKCIDIAGGSMS
jgi:methionine--tRNA ligase beta chain